MLHGTIRNDDFLRNTALQCWNSVVTIGNNVATVLQRCCAKSRRSESSCVIGGFQVYVIATMLVNGKQKITHQLVLFIHQHLLISPLLFVSPEIAWKPAISPLVVQNSGKEDQGMYKKVCGKVVFFTNQKKGVLHVQSCWFANQIYCCFLPFSLSAYHLYGNFGEKFPSNGTGIIFWHRKQEQG